MQVATLVEDSVRNEILFPFIDNANDGDLYVELGVFVGGNLVRIANRIKEKNKKVKVIGIDNWQFGNISSESMNFANVQPSSDFYSVCRENLNNNNCDFVELLNGDSDNLASTFEDKSISCLFVDAAHSCKEYHLNEFRLWAPKVKDGGVIAGHDWPSGGIQDAVVEFFNGKDIFVCSSNGAYKVLV